MTDPLSNKRTESIQPDDMVESTLLFVGDRLRDRPDLAGRIRGAVESITNMMSKESNPADADTVSFAFDSSHKQLGPAEGRFGYRRFGDYELIQEIARGGMGVVYKARHLSLDRTVALKMILSGQLADADDVRRFRIEAQAAANLDHPGIVPIFEIGENDGQHFYSMGFIEGHSLAEELRDGPIVPRKAAEYTRKVSEAIAFAHSRGVIHRDLKPGNVLVDQTGEPKVTDFGLAKRTDADSELTGTGHVLGTPAYMPPEQASGRVDLVKESADVYSLGAMLYCLLTRRPPFQAANPIDTLLQVINKVPVSLRQIDPSIPKDLETICLKCLRKEPSQRYTSAQELADDLGRWLHGEPIQARPVGRVEKSWLWCKRKPVIAGLVAAIVLVVIVGSAVFWEQQNASRAAGLVESLAKAEPTQIPALIRELDDVRWWAEPSLQQQLMTEGSAVVDRTTRLHARMALVGHDSTLVVPLQEELLNNHVSYVGPIRTLLRPYASKLTPELCTILKEETIDSAGDERRFRAALALADFVPVTDVSFWMSTDLRWIAEQLVSSNPEFQPLLRDHLRPIYRLLLSDLESIFGDPEATDAQRTSAANAFADYVASDLASWSRLLAVATPEQYAVLYPLVAANPTSTAIDELAKIAATLPPDDLGSVERVGFGQRRANAAVILLKLGEREKVLPVFDMTDDPEALTQFIFRCRERGVHASELLELLQVTPRRFNEGPSSTLPDASVDDGARMRYALLLALGEYSLTEVPESQRDSLLEQLAEWYRNDPSSGVHGAAGWLLRRWGQTDIVLEVDQTPVPYSPDREWFTLAITITPNPSDTSSVLQTALPQQTFYYTFIVFPAGEYTIGSVDDETGLEESETRHSVTLTRPFALLDREITFLELIFFSPKYAGFMQQADSHPTDAGLGADWYDSVRYCRWLGAQMGLAEADQAYADPAKLDAESYPREPEPSANWAPRNWPLELGRTGFRLPTESEWEVASRAGSRTSYGFGSDGKLLGWFGWFLENSDKHAHSPKKLRPSIRGLFDLQGNLFEWTHDWDWTVSADSLTDPLGGKEGSTRVGRGGCWSDGAASCRSASRYAFVSSIRSHFIGFRLALSPTGVPNPAE